jgi:flagellar protein FlaG
MSMDEINAIQAGTAAVGDVLQKGGSPRSTRSNIPPVGHQELPNGAATAATGEEISKEEAEAIARILNESTKLNDVSLQFRVDEELNRIIVTVVNKETNEIIRQIPPDEVLAIAKRIGEMVGLLVNATA